MIQKVPPQARRQMSQIIDAVIGRSLVARLVETRAVGWYFAPKRLPRRAHTTHVITSNAQ
jgi:hypothetical protein